MSSDNEKENSPHYGLDFRDQRGVEFVSSQAKEVVQQDHVHQAKVINRKETFHERTQLDRARDVGVGIPFYGTVPWNQHVV